jgi:hypothetical protein
MFSLGGWIQLAAAEKGLATLRRQVSEGNVPGAANADENRALLMRMQVGRIGREGEGRQRNGRCCSTVEFSTVEKPLGGLCTAAVRRWRLTCGGALHGRRARKHGRPRSRSR